MGLGFGRSLGQFGAFSRLSQWRIVLELGSAASSELVTCPSAVSPLGLLGFRGLGLIGFRV